MGWDQVVGWDEDIVLLTHAVGGENPGLGDVSALLPPVQSSSIRCNNPFSSS